MSELIKKNVIDCVNDQKRQCVEIVCVDNLAGEETVAFLKSKLPSGVIKEIRYVFGTKEFEVETFTKEQSKELERIVLGIISGQVSYSFWDQLLGFGKASVDKIIDNKNDSKLAKIDAETEVLKYQAEMQAAAADSKYRFLALGIGGAVLLVVILLLVILK